MSRSSQAWSCPSRQGVCPTRRSRVVFQQVKLYDAEMIYQLGLGFWGWLEWVAAGSLVTGLIEQSVSNQMAAEGVAQLRQAAALAKRIREQARYMPVSSVENVHYPELGLWRSSVAGVSSRREVVQFAGDYVYVKAEEKEVAIFWRHVEQYEITEIN